MKYNDENTLYEISQESTTIILLPKNSKNKKYTSVLIWLTGLDESSEDYIDMFNHEPSLLPHPEKNKIIILCGEKMKITAFKDDPRGDVCHSWFNVYRLNNIINSSGDFFNFEDVKNSEKKIINIIEKEAQYLKGYDNIFLGGFSQGACMSLHIGLSYDKVLGGIISCSGALFPKTIINKNNENLKIFVSHGELDDLIDKNINELSIKRINHFPNLEIHYYPNIGHLIEQNALVDLNKFFTKNMK